MPVKRSLWRLGPGREGRPCLLVAALVWVLCWGALHARGEPRVYRDHVDPHWFAGDSRFWYRNDLSEGKREFIVVDAGRGERRAAFDHAKLAEALSAATGAHVSADRLPIDSLQFSEDGKRVVLIGPGRNWEYDLEANRVSEWKGPVTRPVAPRQRRGPRARPVSDRSQRESVPSPDGHFEAFVRDHNLWLRDTRSGEQRPLSTDANADETYHRDVYRERAIGLNYDAPEPPASLPEVYWSPDSKRLAAVRTRRVAGRNVYLVQSSPHDQLQPKLESYPYLKAGDAIPLRRVHLFEVEGRREAPIDSGSFANPWDISEIRWSPDSSRFTFVYNQRGHQALRVIAVDGASGAVKTIIDEQSDSFIDYSGKFYCEYLDDSGEILWMSERDGWNHLYLYDAKTGRVKNQVTKGQWVVRGVDHVDTARRQVWFRAGGLVAGEDPYFIHDCRANFDGSGLVDLTPGNGTHAAQFSADRKYLVDTFSRIDAPPVTVLRRCEDGGLACKLEETDAREVLAERHAYPEPFVAAGRNGATPIYGVIFRPADFDPMVRYPVVESIYAGPQGSYVPKSFRATYPPQRLADQGFVVVQMDGMGTSNRSKKFHDVCWRNLGDAGLPDHILWIKAAAAKYPYLDLSRVGIYGTSAGGQSALGALLFHGEFYACAVADSGCHDNRMDKIWWNEQWMGWPVGPWYAQQSNVTNASQLRGDLLLMVGEMDRNVDPASTMQVVDALVRADKPFELLVMPNQGHGILRTAYGRQRMLEFFTRHLRPPHATQAPSLGKGGRP